MRIPSFAGRRSVGHVLLVAAVIAAPFISSSIAHAEAKTKLLHSFSTSGDGAEAQGVIRAPDGSLYGTTSWGGANCGNSGCGTVFKTTPDKKEVILHSFNDQDGQHPDAAPILDGSGNLWGTAFSGGADNYGVVFKVTPDGDYTVAHGFTGGSDGGMPYGVVLDSEGNLFGVAINGGANNGGVLYEITSQGQFQVLHSFSGGADGGYPTGAPVVDDKGNVYGTTQNGGNSNYGIIYRLTPKGEEKVLYSFGYQDGCQPYGGVVRDDDGNLYGTTQQCLYGSGTLYKLSPSGRFMVLHAFGGGTSNDGLGPKDPPTLVKTLLGKVELYGVTPSGGSSNNGIVYRYSGKGSYKIIHNFAGGDSDASGPSGSLATGPDGKFYGASVSGGSAGLGTVFELRTRY